MPEQRKESEKTMINNEHIRDFLGYYCQLQKPPKYAVLLTGLWGSGKTWFIKDFIENHLAQSERVLYVSLYGMQSFEDIESELFRLLHPVLGSKPVKILHRLARGVIKSSINFDINGDGKADGSISGGLPTEKILDRISLDATTILVLDDLERCSIPTPDLMGYVNQFIEHGGIKAILIANEEELANAASVAAFSYARIKEKLIGRTFEVAPEVESALKHFAEELSSLPVKSVVQSNVSYVMQVYESSKYKNLRLVRHALWDFDRLFQSLDQSVQESDELIRDLLMLFLAYSFEVRSGAINPLEIEKLQDNHWLVYLRQNAQAPDPDQCFHDIRSKYTGLHLYTSLVQSPIWAAIFSTGSVPREELNASLLKSKYFQDKNQPNWVKLWYGSNLSDDSFASVLVAVENDWSSRVYRDLGEIIHVTGLLIKYAKYGIYSYSVEDVIESAKKYVEELFASGDIQVSEPNSRPLSISQNSYAGLAYASMEEPKFQEFFKYIDDYGERALQESFPAQANTLFSLIDSDVIQFCSRIICSNSIENKYYKTAILHFIDEESFVQKLLAISPENWGVLARAIEERYSFDQFSPELLPELDWLIKVAELLRQKISEREGKVSAMSLQLAVVPRIESAIDLLSKFKPMPIGE